MNYEYAYESYIYNTKKRKMDTGEQYKENFPKQELQYFKSLVTEKELLNYLESFNNEKITSIVNSIKDSANFKHVKITDKQRHALASFLLEQKTGQQILEEIFGEEITKLFNV